MPILRSFFLPFWYCSFFKWFLGQRFYLQVQFDFFCHLYSSQKSWGGLLGPGWKHFLTLRTIDWAAAFRPLFLTACIRWVVMRSKWEGRSGFV